MLVYTVSKGREKLHPMSFSFRLKLLLLLYIRTLGTGKGNSRHVTTYAYTGVLNTNCY